MKLDTHVNYIVSGLERSGTSMLMQILQAGGIPVAFDHSRAPDPDNPRGYYELAGGKIINKLIEQSFPLDDYKGSFIKITAYGLRYLPPGNYRIIYSERRIQEILDSMEKMIGEKDEKREETKQSFIKLNQLTKNQIKKREDINVCFVNYNHILSHPQVEIKKIKDFLGLPEINLDNMIRVVDKKLYRQRR